MDDPEPTTAVIAALPALASLFGLHPAGEWALTALALLLAGLFATLREALAQCSPGHVRELVPEGPAREALDRALANTERPTVLAGTLEVGATLLFLAGLLDATGAASEPSALRLGATIAIGLPLLLLATRILPAALDRALGDRILASMLRSVRILDLALLPLTWPLDVLRRLVLRALGLREERATTRHLVEELREVIEDAELEDALPESGLALIGNVMDFHDMDVEAVMTPRTEIQAVSASATLAELVHAITESGHSRLPVHTDGLDSIIGWVAARDVLRAIDSGASLGEGGEFKIQDLLHPPTLVPETKSIAELLREFQSSRIQLAIVLDEYGGTAGIVTIDDLLEELVGEMLDEHDAVERAAYRRLPSGAIEVDAAEHVTDVNEALGLHLPEEEDFETLAGFILAHFGRFPAEGEAFEHEGCRFTVVEATDRRVLAVRVRRSEAVAS